MRPRLAISLATTAAAIAAFGVASCGGPDLGVGAGNTNNGTLAGNNGAIAEQLAPYQVLDLVGGKATTATAVPDLFTNPAYATSKMVFRRVHGLSADYFLAVFELTQGQWKQLSGGSTPWTAVPTSVVPAPASGTDTDQLPAYNISYSLVVSTISTWNKTAVGQLGLPSIAQWQYACAAGSDPNFWSWGTSSDPTVASHYANLNFYTMPPTASQPQPAPETVGKLLPNAFGFYDMQGNVWEWTEPGPHICGGSWHDGLEQARTSNIAGSDSCVVTTETQHALIGARLVYQP